MRTLIAALAMSVLALPNVPIASAQLQLREVAAETATSKAPRAETTGGNTRNPDPHIYKLGEHLSEAYGSHEIIDDWQTRRLTAPPEGHHWVRYGSNYMLVTATDGLITRIVRAT